MTVESPTIVQPVSAPVVGTGPRSGGAKLRVLDTADRLFSDEGIRVVGVDRLIAESSVTKATFYKHFGAKDTLVLHYLTRRHEADVAEHDEVASSIADGAEALRELVERLAARLQKVGFRGSPYANAAAEFSDPTHPVRGLVAEHREWRTGAYAELFQRAGHAMPGDAADDLQLAVNGAQLGAYAGDAIAAVASLRRTVDRLLAA